MPTSPLQPDPDQDARTRFRVLLASGGLVLGLATLLLPHPEPFRSSLLVAAVVVSVLILVGLLWPRSVDFWDVWGDLLAVATVALVVAATGGSQSVYQDLFLLPLLAAAALHPRRRLVSISVLTLIALLLPVLYDGTDLTGPFATDLVVDATTWLLAAAVVHRQSEHRRLQEADARDNQVRFRHMAEHAQDGIYRLRLEPDVAFEYVNPAMQEVTGFAPEDFYADPRLPLRRVHPDDRELVRRTRTRPEALPDTVEVRWQHRDGHWMWHSLREAAIVEDGELKAIQGIVRDVTPQKIREEALEHDLARHQEAAEDLRQLDAAKTTTIRAVAHDLRSPLMAIKGFAEVLRGRHDLAEEDVDRMIDRIGTAATRLERILSDLLELEQLGMERALARDPVDVAALTRTVVSEIDAPEHEITVDARDGITVEADGPKLERAIENLVANAVRHTPAGTRVVITVQPDGNGSTITVEDDGPGIPDDLKETIFRPFERGSSSGEGTGVGLSLVHAIAELHGGRTWVEDAESGGARFVLSLPGPT